MTALPLVLLTANSALRTVLVLLIIWLVLRMIDRARKPAPQGQRRTNWASPDDRRRGEVRIERTQEPTQHRPPGDVEDADFEEIK